MVLRVFNTLSGKKEVFSPVEEGKVKMYVCGMTVYSDVHIGHARTYLAFDIIRRYLEYKGYDVFYVQNITDVDDKIIRAANERGMDPLEYSKYYAERCLSDLDKLGIRRADLYPKASENVDEMIKMIERIIENGYGYISGGDVYFSVEKFEGYGKLSKQKLEEMKAGARIEPGEKKRNPLDFALWKSAKPNEPKWKSPWGEGRPGWHIECSAMSSKYLGLPFDIHGGGSDLIFPHHENEIAQTEAAYGKGFAKYWLHTGLLSVEGEKMSKSLGNIIPVREILKEFDAEVIRFFLASTHYRKPANFTFDAVENAKTAVERIYRIYDRLSAVEKEGEVRKDIMAMLEVARRNFEDAMDDDFNTPKALAVIFNYIGKINELLDKGINANEAKTLRENLVRMCNVLTLLQGMEVEIKLDSLIGILEKYAKGYKAKDVEDAIDHLLSIREKARKEKNWALADAIRSDLQSVGLEIEDTKEGTIWRKKRTL